MTDEIIVRLMIISHSRSPEAISSALGIEHDEGWHKGETRAKTKIIEKNNGWILSSKMPRSASLTEQVRRLIGRLSPHKDKVMQICNEDTVIFSCVIYSERRPPLEFSNPDLRAIAELGADLDIDVYIVEPD